MYIQQDDYVIDMKESVLFHKGIVLATGIECLKWKKILKGGWVKIHSLPRYPIQQEETNDLVDMIPDVKGSFFYDLDKRR